MIWAEKDGLERRGTANGSVTVSDSRMKALTVSTLFNGHGDHEPRRFLVWAEINLKSVKSGRFSLAT
jgi:hypothetical protein